MQIDRKTNEAKTKIEDTGKEIGNLVENFNQLQTQILQNDVLATSLESQSIDISKKAHETSGTLENLQTEYKDAKSKLNKTLHNAENSKQRADLLVQKAIFLTANVTKMDEDIKRLQQTQSDRNLDDLENEITKLIEKMRHHDRIIQARKDYYNSC